MIELLVIREFLKSLPVPGDVIERIDNNKIIYESGAVLSMKNISNLKNGYLVKSINYDINVEENSLSIGVVHILGSINEWHDKNVEILQLSRKFKIEKLMKISK